MASVTSSQPQPSPPQPGLASACTPPPQTFTQTWPSHLCIRALSRLWPHQHLLLPAHSPYWPPLSCHRSRSRLDSTVYPLNFSIANILFSCHPQSSSFHLVRYFHTPPALGYTCLSIFSSQLFLASRLHGALWRDYLYWALLMVRSRLPFGLPLDGRLWAAMTACLFCAEAFRNDECPPLFCLCQHQEKNVLWPAHGPRRMGSTWSRPKYADLQPDEDT